MKLTTKSTVTIVMTGAEATNLAEWLYGSGAERDNGVAGDLLNSLQQLPDEVDEPEGGRG